MPQDRLAGFLRKAVKFGAVGLSSVAVYFVILALLRPVIASVALLAAVAYVGSAVFNYIAQSRFTFDADTRDTGAMLRYGLMHGLCIVINSAGMHLSVVVWGLNFWLSQLAVTVLVAGTSFLLSYLWVYDHKRH